ncbi:MAG TPA: hypothetical protein PKC43_10380 [Phycisphaerales bacterium]|nr:hypothetical protein [Phycisphaerales bacterium]HMP37843.1 hypothetical protein [Phycisphaerales bacterium]
MSTVRNLVAVAMLAIGASAAGWVWWNRIDSRSDAVVAYVESLVEGASRTTGDALESAARAKLGAVARNAGARLDIRVNQGDLKGSDGRASHWARVANDVGDEIILRLVVDGEGRCKVIGVQGDVQGNPNDELGRPRDGERAAPPRFL